MRFNKISWIKIFTLRLFKKDSLQLDSPLKLSTNDPYPEYKIIVQEFCDKFNKIIFKIKNNHSEEVIVKTAGEISLDKHLIDNLSRQDACIISFTAGYEQFAHPALTESNRFLNKYLVFFSALFLCIMICNAVLMILMLIRN